MKKFLAVLLGIVGTMALAADDEVFACCATHGPDYYSDGDLVAEGECYALVYTNPGAVFAGFRADGSLADPATSEVVMVLPMAKGGRCRQTLCVVPRTFANRRRTGVWELFLLDTRTAAGAPAGVDADGQLRRVNSWGRTDASISFTTSAYSTQAAKQMAVLQESFATMANVPSTLPEDVRTPRIAGISVDGDRVSLEVADTEPYLTYDVAGADRLDREMAEGAAVRKRDGVADGKMVIEADGAQARFFKVVVSR